jgi:hypothetical protein
MALTGTQARFACPLVKNMWVCCKSGLNKRFVGFTTWIAISRQKYPIFDVFSVCTTIWLHPKPSFCQYRRENSERTRKGPKFTKEWPNLLVPSRHCANFMVKPYNNSIFQIKIRTSSLPSGQLDQKTQTPSWRLLWPWILLKLALPLRLAKIFECVVNLVWTNVLFYRNVDTNSTAFLKLSLTLYVTPCSTSFSGYYIKSGHVSPMKGMT